LTLPDGSKAFTYFSVITKNLCLQKLKQLQKKSSTDVVFDKEILDVLEKKYTTITVQPYDLDMEKVEFMELLKEEVRSWRAKMHKEQDRLILDAIILLMHNTELIEIGNKKAIYLYLREITGLSTKQIVMSLIKFRKKYIVFRNRYLEGNV
jgi:hypothetical protein